MLLLRQVRDTFFYKSEVAIAEVHSRCGNIGV